MSNRSEKERRREERLAAEQAAQQSADRRKRFGLVGGVVLVIAVIAIVAIAIGSGGGDDGPKSSKDASNAKPPTFGVSDLSDAAKAAGCKVTLDKLPEEGRGHTAKKVTYKTNPPTSGDHNPTAAQDGIYDAANPPELGMAVHSLEHGRVDFQYKPGTPKERIAQMESMVSEKVKGTPGYHSLLFQNQTAMSYAVAATAWRESLTCPSWNDKVFDAMRAFRKTYVDKAPEFIP